jgi:hypothetical protein
MKWALLILSCLLPAAQSASLGEVKSVYLLPMAFGLDQYLASRLTSIQVLPVVADPKAADAILTDRLGPAFEARLDELYPPPPPPAKSEEEKEKEKQAAEGKEDQEPGGGDSEIVRGPGVGGMSTFGRGRGNIFLVDVATRRVLWSTHEPPRDGTTAELDRTAERIARDIRKALLGKTK